MARVYTYAKNSIFINQIIGSARKYLTHNKTLEKYNFPDAKRELINFAIFSNYTYNRNILHKDNNLELVLIGWSNGQMTDIHDHVKGGCVFEVLYGKLMETRFTYDKYDKYLYKYNIMRNINERTYIAHKDKHKIYSPTISISLHLYAYK